MSLPPTNNFSLSNPFEPLALPTNSTRPRPAKARKALRPLKKPAYRKITPHPTPRALENILPLPSDKPTYTQMASGIDNRVSFPSLGREGSQPQIAYGMHSYIDALQRSQPRVPAPPLAGPWRSPKRKKTNSKLLHSPPKKQRTRDEVTRSFSPTLFNPVSKFISSGPQNYTGHNFEAGQTLPQTFSRKLSLRESKQEEKPKPALSRLKPINLVNKIVLPPDILTGKNVLPGGKRKALESVLNSEKFTISRIHFTASRLGQQGATETVASFKEHRIDVQGPSRAFKDIISKHLSLPHQRIAYQVGSGQNVYAQVVVSGLALRFLNQDSRKDGAALLEFIRQGLIQSFVHKKQFIINCK